MGISMAILVAHSGLITTIHLLRFLFSLVAFLSATALLIIMSNMYIRDRARIASDVTTSSEG